MKRDILRVNRATTQSIDFGGNVKHTSIIPMELVDTILAGVIRPDMLVVDPTCGSGTTGVSALGFGAYFCGYDLNDSFLELANHRMEQRLNELHGIIKTYRPKPTFSALLHHEVLGSWLPD